MTSVSRRSAGRRAGFESLLGALDGAGEAALIERLQHIIDRIHFKRLDRVVVKRGRENDLREFRLAVHQLLDHAEAIEARHLNIEEYEVWRVLLDKREGFDSVLALADKVHLGKTLQQEREFVARGLFVIHDECVNRHERA